MPAPFALDKLAKSYPGSEKFSGEGTDVGAKYRLFCDLFVLAMGFFTGCEAILKLDFTDPIADIPLTVNRIHDANVYTALLFVTTGTARMYVRNSVLKDGTGENVLSGLRAWAKLRNLYSGRTLGHVTATQEKIFIHKFPESRDPSRSISILCDLFSEMFNLEAELSEYAKITCIVKALPQTYHALRTALSMRTDLTTLLSTTVFDMVQTHWNDVVSRNSSNGELNAMSYGRGSGGKGKGKGRGSYNTGRGRQSQFRNGHVGVRNTWTRNGKGSSNGASGSRQNNDNSDIQCYKCKRWGHYADDCLTQRCPVCGSFEHSPWNCPTSNYLNGNPPNGGKGGKGSKGGKDGRGGQAHGFSQHENANENQTEETPPAEQGANAHAVTYCMPVTDNVAELSVGQEDLFDAEMEEIEKKLQEMEAESDYDSANDMSDSDDDLNMM